MAKSTDPIEAPVKAKRKGPPALTPEQKAARKAEKDKVNNRAKSLKMTRKEYLEACINYEMNNPEVLLDAQIAKLQEMKSAMKKEVL